MKQIWMLFRGTSKKNLQPSETILALHLIHLYVKNRSTSLPDELDPDLIELIRDFEARNPKRASPRIGEEALMSLAPSKPLAQKREVPTREKVPETRRSGFN